MRTYICLLRGINVSGQKLIKMVKLKASFEGLGFENVITYIQSGNIVFKSDKNDTKSLENKIHKMLLDDYGFDITVVILTPEQIQAVVSNNPFEKDGSKDIKKLCVVFLQNQPLQEHIEKLKEVNYSPEELVFNDKIIYFYAAFGAGRTKLNTNFFENKLKVKATARNWRTTNKLLEMTCSIS